MLHFKKNSLSSNVSETVALSIQSKVTCTAKAKDEHHCENQECELNMRVFI